MRPRAALLAAVAAAVLAAPSAGTAQAPAAADTSVVFALGDPSPNPFQEEVRIPFRLGPPPPAEGAGPDGDGPPPPDSVRVSVAVYNVLWQRVAWARTSGDRDGGVPVRDRWYDVPGEHAAVWRGRTDGGRRVPSGPYFVELRVDGRTAVRKVLLTR